VTLACIHDAAENFPDRETGRYRLDLNHLLHRQVAAVIELKEVKEETRSYLLELSSRLDASVGALPDLSWTRCHGDCHGVNARIVTAGPKAGQARFFDFDDGGFGYLAYDLAVHLWAQLSFQRRRHAMWHAFIDGYRARSIPLGIMQSVLAERDLTQSGKYSGNVRMIWAKRLLADRKRSSQHGFGFGHFALCLQGLSKHNKGGCRQR